MPLNLFKKLTFTYASRANTVLSMFKEIESQDELAKLSAEVLDFWKKNRIFERSVEERDPKKPFVFFEGPPTANGRPGIHHVLARSMKDFVCRYKTMQGYRVERKGGWDTHGLPVEIEVEKSLKLSGKKDIEAFGMEAFNKKCFESVWTYKELWDQLTDRMGYWVDLKDPYITCDNNYVESVWWILKQYFEKGLVYKGFKVVPYCPKCGTPLSSHEVAQGYQDVSDPSVYVKMKVHGHENTYFLVWTTTPWTLISNVALAVGKDIDYVKAKYKDQFLFLAEARVKDVLKEDYEIVERFKGAHILGWEYERLFDDIPVDKKAFFVIPGDFVTTDDGSGIVHTAPAFGEDDYQVCKANGLPFLRPVDAAGKFEETVKEFKGMFVKDADPEIITNLKRRGMLFRSEKFKHSYPHCWRHRTPLIYYARDAWYIRTTTYKDNMVANNETVQWFPPEIKEGRFGNWLRNNIDWSLSRDRYWGTPLPIWVHEESGEMICVGSREELQKGRMKDGSPVPADLDLHKPYVDHVVIEKDGKTFTRTPEVIDVWFDSGAMPYAQWHYPFENKEIFERQYPADFICEGVDQTRGWFYSLMSISTFLFGKAPYKNVVVNELVLDGQGRKMSKSLGNVVNPFEMLDQYGADILRWYLLVNTPIWLPKRFDLEGLTEMKKKFFRPLLETYKFFTLYANIDGFDPKAASIALSDRTELDRWILSRLHSTVREVTEHLNQFDTCKAGKLIQEFVDQDLSNWYIRLSRRRFWKGEKGSDKTAAYQTLFEILETLSRLIAPFCPFLAEKMYRHLMQNEDDKTSVHLAYFPEAEKAKMDLALETKMSSPRRVVQLGRALRELKELKVRQPLAKIIVVTEKESVRGHINDFSDIIKNELNVKAIEFVTDTGSLVNRKAKPNFKALGPKFGKNVNMAAQAIKDFSEKEISLLIEKDHYDLNVAGHEVAITKADVEILHEEKEGLAVQSDADLTVALDTHLTAELVDEGIAREFINRVQNLRKDADFEVTDRIIITLQAEPTILKAIQNQKNYIMNETLATEISVQSPEGEIVRGAELHDTTLEIGLRRVRG
ncbi:MAG TPA: isoleucine--tRNA ligase [bacterium]|nr:isoleucine--tRNA ligase [bacterium]